MTEIHASSPDELLKQVITQINTLSADELLKQALRLSNFFSWDVNDAEKVGIQGAWLTKALAKGADINKFVAYENNADSYFVFQLFSPHMDILCTHLNGNNLIRLALKVWTMSYNKTTQQHERDPDKVRIKDELITRALAKLSADDVLRRALNIDPSKDSDYSEDVMIHKYSEDVRIQSALITEALTKAVDINKFVAALKSDMVSFYFSLDLFSHNMDILCTYLNSDNLLKLALQAQASSFNKATWQWEAAPDKARIKGELITRALVGGADINSPSAYEHLTLEEFSQHMDILCSHLNSDNLLKSALKASTMQDPKKIRIQKELVIKALAEGADINSPFAYEYLTLQHFSQHMDILSTYLNSDNLLIVRFLMEDAANAWSYNVEEVSGNGQPGTVKYLLLNGSRQRSKALEKAASSGDLEMVKYLVANEGKIGLNAIEKAADNGHLKMVQFLVEKSGKISDDAVANAVRNGHLEVAKFLAEKGGKIDDYAVYNAVRDGHFELVKFLVEKGGKIEDGAVREAATQGHFEEAEFLLEHGGMIGDSDVYYAAINGHVDAAEFLLKYGGKIEIKETEIRERDVYLPIWNDQLEVVGKIFAGTIKEMEMRDDDVYSIAMNGRFDVAEFLLKHGAKIGDDDVYNAVMNGRFDVAEFMLKHGGTIGDHSVHSTAVKGNFKAAIFMWEHGGKITDIDVYAVAMQGHVDAAKFLWKLAGYNVANATKMHDVLKDAIEYAADGGPKVKFPNAAYEAVSDPYHEYNDPSIYEEQALEVYGKLSNETANHI